MGKRTPATKDAAGEHGNAAGPAIPSGILSFFGMRLIVGPIWAGSEV